MFNRMLSALGIGGPSVDTVLDSPHAVPGQAITGQVRVQGGSSDAEIGEVVLSLVLGGEAEFFRVVVQQGVRVPANQLVSIPFQLTLPWETPITAVGGMQLPGVSVGVRTELTIEGAPDKGDLDPITVGPLPSQNKVLDAFGQLGFTFRGTEIAGGRQQLAFFPPAQLAGSVNEVDLTFVATAHELYVVLEADKRSGRFAAGDAVGEMRLSHEQAQVTDWASAINGWLSQIVQRGQLNPAFGNQPVGYGSQGYDHDGYGQRRGPGMGGMMAAGAAGVVGGMVLGGVANEFFDDED
jgi:sporulation-control protein